jgi:methyl-accepting chemotaxis protein
MPWVGIGEGNMKLKLSTKLVGITVCVGLLTVVTGAVGVGFVHHVGGTGMRIGAELAPLGDAAMEIKLNAYVAHTELEELVGGDTTITPEQVTAHWALAQWYAHALIEGGENDEGRFVASRDPVVQTQVKRVLTSLEEVSALSARRVAYVRDGGGDAAEIRAQDAAFDARFGQLVHAADEAEEAVHRAMVLGYAELNSGLAAAEWTLGAITTLAFALSVLLGVFLSRPLVRAFAQLAETMERVAGKDLRDLAQLDRDDEIGAVGQAVDVTIEVLRDTLQLILDSANSVAGASEEIAATTHQLDGSAASTLSRSLHASDAARGVRDTLEEVGVAAEEVSQSIAEIGGSLQTATSVARDAITRAGSVAEAIEELVRSSQEIDQVSQTISGIAEQTNLLALNATIEAARAGEAGRGFAVVAGEVKNLAADTSTATRDIAEKIGTVQAAVERVTTGTHEMRTVIERIEALQANIAGAVAQQTGSNAAILEHVRRAARSSADIADSIGEVERAARDTAGGAENTREAMSQIARMATELQAMAAQFRLA